jgi:diguanylate cyclase (GGDEF)-like protein/PAS domain S-box-containing protein
MTEGDQQAVLIVEDDAATAELERRALARAGTTAVIVSCVQDALELLDKQSFAAILLDYQLPDGDPWAVFEAAHAKRPRIPVVIVTGQGNERIASEALHRGVADYLKKSDTFWEELPGILGRVTLLVTAEERLRESEERFRGAFEFAAIGMALVAPDGRWLQVNHSLCRIVGYTAEELLATDFQTITHPDDLDTDVGYVRQMLEATLSHYDMEKRYFHKDGHIIWVLLSVSLVRDAAGRPLYFVSQIQDITEQRQLAQDLRISERRFRESMEHSPIGMLIADLNGVWAYSNLALQQMLGYTAEELRALPPGGPSNPEDWKENKISLKPLLSGEIDFHDTTRSFRHKDGHWVWTHVAVSILRDEDGVPIHLIGQIESLEARQRAEEKLVEERERLKITLQSINDAVITTDANSRITYINAAAESLLGLEMSAVEGRRVDEVIHLMDPQTSKAAANLIGQSAFHGKVFRREQSCLLHRPDGTICYVTDVVTPVLDSTGHVSGMVIVFRDVTHDVDRARDLHHRAMHDPLTGLNNRAEFELRLRAVFGKAHHLDHPAAVMAIDLDRFKAVNDAAGHAAGDAVLCMVAEACRMTVRSSDVVARLGGDEFAVILDNCAEDRAQYLGQQLLRALNPLNIDWEGSHYTVGASIGVAMRATDMPDEKTWLDAADRACYDAKRQGRGRLRIATRWPGDELPTKQG